MYSSVSRATFIVFLFVSICITLILIFFYQWFKLSALVGGSLCWALLFDLYNRNLVVPVWILCCLWNHCFENLEVRLMHSTISLMFFCYCYKENLSLCLHTPSLKKKVTKAIMMIIIILPCTWRCLLFVPKIDEHAVTNYVWYSQFSVALILHSMESRFLHMFIF